MKLSRLNYLMLAGVGIFVSVLILQKENFLKGQYFNTIGLALISAVIVVLFLGLFKYVETKSRKKKIRNFIIYSFLVLFNTLIFYFVVFHEDGITLENQIYYITGSFLNNLLMVVMIIYAIKKTKTKTK